MRIDAHVHLLPAAYRTELTKRGLLPYPLPEWSLDQTDAFLSHYEIDAAVLSLSPPGVWFGDSGLARELARMVNEQIARSVVDGEGRYAGLGVIPLPDVDAAVDEVHHVLNVLGLDGVALLTNLDGCYLGTPEWDPVLEALDRAGAYVFIHPTADPLAALPQYPVWLQEFPFDTTRAIVNLIYSGALERFPRLRIQVAHLGGTAPFLAHRIASLGVRDPAFQAFSPERVLHALAGLYYDTGLANHVAPIDAVCAHVPFDHIVFGSDWPYAAMPNGRDFATELDSLGHDRRRDLEERHVGSLVTRWGSAGEAA
jgi:6-methylsalicylate decarboxylase